jgi:ABC-type multidrug transport system permease subunit
VSKQERASWTALVVNVLIGVWYFSAIFSLPGDLNLYSRALMQLIIKMIIVSIVVAIAAEIVFHILAGQPKDKVSEDERDQVIDTRAARNGYYLLVAGVFVIITRIVMAVSVEQMPAFKRAGHTAGVIETLFATPVSPIYIANLLLLAFFAAGTAVHASRIFYYRRGY